MSLSSTRFIPAMRQACRHGLHAAQHDRMQAWQEGVHSHPWSPTVLTRPAQAGARKECIQPLLQPLQLGFSGRALARRQHVHQHHFRHVLLRWWLALRRLLRWLLRGCRGLLARRQAGVGHTCSAR